MPGCLRSAAGSLYELYVGLVYERSTSALATGLWGTGAWMARGYVATVKIFVRGSVLVFGLFGLKFVQCFLVLCICLWVRMHEVNVIYSLSTKTFGNSEVVDNWKYLRIMRGLEGCSAIICACSEPHAYYNSGGVCESTFLDQP